MADKVVAIIAELEFAYLVVMLQVQFKQTFYVYFCSEWTIGDYMTYDEVLEALSVKLKSPDSSTKMSMVFRGYFLPVYIQEGGLVIMISNIVVLKLRVTAQWHYSISNRHLSFNPYLFISHYGSHCSQPTLFFVFPDIKFFQIVDSFLLCSINRQ